MGELVYLKTRSYKQKTIERHINDKLGLRYYRPYKINHQIRQVSYKLDLLKESLVYPVFHVSQLKKAEGLLESVAVAPLSAKLEFFVQLADIL